MFDLPTLTSHVARVKASIRKEPDIEGRRWAKDIQGGVQSTLSVLSAVYGPLSHQVASFKDRLKKGVGQRDNIDHLYEFRIADDVDAALDAAVRDVEGGVNTPGIHAAGEVLGDFASLAHNTLDVKTDAADRVAAVLVAAALEESLKRLGVAQGLDVQGRDMRTVIEKLREAGVLIGAQLSLAHGFVTFRDKALHAQFDQVSRATTESALTFLETFLTKAFA